MRKLVFIAFAISFAACSNHKADKKLFSSSNLKTQYFLIDPTADTILLGSRGGVFRFEKGSFEGADPVTIELKEAYSLAEMLYAGLRTESDGRLLESGGMIYVNAKRKGRPLSLVKAVEVSIPTHYVNKDMKLFIGDVLADSTINWIEPTALDFRSNLPAVDSGEILFKSRCANCHNIFKDLTGPALALTEERVKDRSLLRSYIRNPAAVTAENTYFQCLKQRFGSMMTGAPDLTDREIDLILDYIKNEENKRPDLLSRFRDQQGEEGVHFKCETAITAPITPCGLDTIYVDTTNYPSAQANMLPLEATKDDSLDSQYEDPAGLETIQRKGLTDVVFTEGLYNFKIKTLGWFNVDAFYEGMPGTEIVDLFVDTDFDEEWKLDIHIFFPAKKLLTVGVWHKDDGLFHFQKYKGQIPLFVGDEAVALGVTSSGENIFYGISAFKVGKSQTIRLNIKKSSKEMLTTAFREMKLEGIDLDIITKKRLITPKPCGDTTIVSR